MLTFIQAWRPIKTVLRGPLALCLADSVPDSDLVPLTYIYPQENNRKAETFLVLPPDGKLQSILVGSRLRLFKRLC